MVGGKYRVFCLKEYGVGNTGGAYIWHMQNAAGLLYNGALLEADAAFISPDMRGFKFGDGCFETMKVVKGQVLLAQFHFERLLGALEKLGFVLPEHYTPAWLHRQVQQLIAANTHTEAARVRITVFRGSGGVYGTTDHFPHTVVQSWALAPGGGWQEKGLRIDICREVVKAADRFSHIKSSNYLSYTLAARWAEERQLDDALVLNQWGRVADATIANVFVVHDGIVKTPAPEEGCIGGVMRRHLLATMRAAGWEVQEGQLTEEMLAEATEIFLTNAISGIRWVESVGQYTYRCQLAAQLYKKVPQE